MEDSGEISENMAIRKETELFKDWLSNNDQNGGRNMGCKGYAIGVSDRKRNSLLQIGEEPVFVLK